MVCRIEVRAAEDRLAGSPRYHTIACVSATRAFICHPEENYPTSPFGPPRCLHPLMELAPGGPKALPDFDVVGVPGSRLRGTLQIGEPPAASPLARISVFR